MTQDGAENIQEQGLSAPVFRLLFFCLTVVGIGNSMLFAVLPALAREIHMPDWTASAIFSLSAALWVLTSPMWGRISDKRGRRVIIITGLSAFGLSFVIFTAIAALGMAGHWPWVLVAISLAVARAIFGAVGSATNPAVQAYVADRTIGEARTKEIGAVTSSFAFGSAAGPALAAFMVGRTGLLSPLILVSAIALVSAFLAYRYLPAHPVPIAQRRKVEDNGNVWGGIWAVARLPAVQPWLIYGLILSAVTAIIYQQLSFFVIDTLHVTPKVGASFAAIALTAGALAQMAAQLGLLPRLQLSARGLVITGAILTAFGTALLVVAQDLGGIVAAQICVGLGFGLARPGFTGGASLAVDTQHQGAVAGLVVASNGAGFVVAPILGAGLYALYGPHAPFILATVILVALATYSFLSKALKAAPLVSDISTLPNSPD